MTNGETDLLPRGGTSLLTRASFASPGGNGTTSRQLGFVAGWLSAKESDFTNAKGRPAALYRAVYVGNELDGDTEDLEVHEATATLWSHSCNGCHCFASDKQTLDQHKARCDASHAADAIAAALEAEATLKRKADALARGVSDGATTRGKSRRATPDPDDARPSPPTTPGPDRASPPPPTAENSSSSPQASLLKPPAHPQDAPPLHALFNPPPPPAAAPRAPAPDDEIGSRRPRDDVPPGAVARRTLNIAEAYDADTDVEEDARDHRDAGLRRGASPAALVPLPSYEFDLGSGVTVDVGLLRHAGAPHLVLRLGADRLTVYRARRDGAADTASVVATVPFPRPNRSES